MDGDADPLLTRIVPLLAGTPGVVAIVVGGSRAKGTEHEASDYDLGLYYGIAIPRGDQTHIAGCVYRALCCMAQSLYAINRRYLINEKGALAEAAGFPRRVGVGGCRDGAPSMLSDGQAQAPPP